MEVAWCYSKCCLRGYENSSFLKIFVRSFVQLTWEYVETFSKWTVLPVGCVSFQLLSVNPENWFFWFSWEQLGEILHFGNKCFKNYWFIFFAVVSFFVLLLIVMLEQMLWWHAVLVWTLSFGVAGCVHVLKRMGLMLITAQQNFFLVLHTYMMSVTCILAGLCLFSVSNVEAVYILLGPRSRFRVLHRSLLSDVLQGWIVMEELSLHFTP